MKLTPQEMANNTSPWAPNSSILNIIEAMGLLTTPQNRAISPTARAEAGVKPQKRSGDTAKSGTDKEGRDNFPSFESRSDGNGSKKNFQRKSFWPGAAADGRGNDIHSGTVISRITKQEGQENDCNTTAKSP